MAEPRFSVVIPTHNRAHIIQYTLGSVFGQSFTDYEIIVLDDGSTDNTAEVMKQFEGRVQYVRQVNSGPGAARNAGAAMARGEYIAFLDSDDLWFPWTLETFDKALRECGSPAMLLGTQRNFRREGDIEEVHRGELKTLQFRDYFASVGVHDFFAATGNLVVKRSEFEKTTGFPTKVRCSEDAHFMLLNGNMQGFCGVTSPFTYALRRSEEKRVTNEAKSCVEGAVFLCRQERLGQYPGGEGSRSSRLKFICDLASDSSLSCVSHGVFGGGYQIYWNIWRWQLRRRQLNYLLGFHCTAGMSVLRQVRDVVRGR